MEGLVEALRFCGGALLRSSPAALAQPRPERSRRARAGENGWPSFSDAASLGASRWGAFFADLYGVLPPPTEYPLNTASYWMLYNSLIAKHSLALPPSAGTCAPPNCQLNRFEENNAYSPPSQWIWRARSRGP